MPVIESKVDLNSAETRANAEAWAGLRGELQQHRDTAALGGNAKSRERHTARGKLLPRERVLQLTDPGSAFLELSQLAADGKAPLHAGPRSDAVEPRLEMDERRQVLALLLVRHDPAIAGDVGDGIRPRQVVASR